MLEIQKELCSGVTPEMLLEKYAIKTRRHQQYPNLVLFKYDQISSPFSERVVRECRGIVLDEDKNWNVVCRAFDKFFNVGEGLAAEIDWRSARVQEKVDGSLCTVYWYRGEWHVATTGSPDATGNVYGTPFTFGELFWHTFNRSRSRMPVTLRDFSVYFELTGPANRVVIPHAEASLTLLGARNVKTGQEHRFRIKNIPSVTEHPLGSYADIAATFDTLSPLQQEGYVIVDRYYNRVKVKHPGYVALHHAKDGMTTKAFVHIARTGEVSEVIAAFPEFKPLLDDAKERYEALVEKVQLEYDLIKSIPSQKNFAIEAVKLTCSAALFNMRSGRAASVREFFKMYSIESLVRLLGYKAESAEVPDVDR